ncbi:hypothetical protein BH23PLA1_BH23PLA1_06360 [soil metagenome]
MAQENAYPESLERQAALGHLASGVGHHVINAFSAIVSNAEILRLSTESGQSHDPLVIADLIVRSAMEASGVARRLIDFTRPLTLPGAQHIALDHLASEVIEEFRDHCASTVQWSVELATVPTVPGNDSHLRAMLLMLLNNAREALPDQRGTIYVSTSMDDRGWVVLEIRDDGQGMTSEVHEQAIEPFYSTRSGHAGVGLSIANGIWRRHRGTLAILTEPGQGTTIRLCIHPDTIDPAPGAATPES